MNKSTNMKNLTKIGFIAIIFLNGFHLSGQELKQLTLAEVVKLAEEQSPNALMAKHRFRQSYWQYRTFVAEYKPSLTMTGETPSYNRSYGLEYNSQTRQEEYVEKNNANGSLGLQLAQNIGATGGRISVQTDLARLQSFGENERIQWTTAPVKLAITQPIFRYNSLKWQKKTEPLRYEQAQKRYLSDIESVHQSAVSYFFQLALAQVQKEIAEVNYFNSDTIYRIAQGRYNLGTIPESDMLQMELTFLNAGTARIEADISLRDRELTMRTFLGFNENVRIELIIPEEVPLFQIEMTKIIELAMTNNPTILQQQLSLLSAESEVARTKAEKGLNANMTLSFGLAQQAETLPDAYLDLSQSQGARLTFTLPVVDWGLGRGKYKMALSNQELTQVQVEQAINDFEQSVMLEVQRFNLQADQIRIAQKSDEVAARMFEVSKQRFLIGRIDVMELNNADTRKDQNRRAYIQSLQTFWSNYYSMRATTLYDIENDKPLTADFERLVR